MRRAAAALAALAWAFADPAAGADRPRNVLVVMSADTGPYREAFAGIQEVFGSGAWSVVAATAPLIVPPVADVVIALGSRASSSVFPARLGIVHAMTPGLPIERQRGVRIAMEPEPDVLIDRLLLLQPKLRRLGVVYQAVEAESYAAALSRAGAARGVMVEARAIDLGVELPDVLRRLSGGVDALWVPPDPLLVNATNLSTLVEFARANRMPLYVPTAGLVAMGATASVAPNFREMGRRSAQAAADAGEAREGGSPLYPKDVEMTVSRKGAAAAGLSLTEADLGKADKVLP